MRLVVRLAAAAALALCAARAQAATPWYVSGSIGGYFREDNEGTTTFSKFPSPVSTPVTGATIAPGGEVTVTAGSLAPITPPPLPIRAAGTIKAAFDPGAVVNAAVGYRLGSHLRLEVEVGYANFTGSRLNPLTSNVNFPHLDGRTFTRRSGDDFTRLGGSFNGFYDFRPVASRFTPYLGAGVGASSNRRTQGRFASADGSQYTTFALTSAAYGFGFAEVGVSLPLSSSLSIVPAYRYVHDFPSNLDISHVFKVAMRYSF